MLRKIFRTEKASRPVPVEVVEGRELIMDALKRARNSRIAMQRARRTTEEDFFRFRCVEACENLKVNTSLFPEGHDLYNQAIDACVKAIQELP